MATIKTIKHSGSNVQFVLQSPISHELKVDQSVAHNGVCLTVEAIQGEEYQVTAIDETLQKTQVGAWQQGQKVNLERCMPANGRYDGHIVQGHVDGVSQCVERLELDGSTKFFFELPSAKKALVVAQGSICVNGISLTVCDVEATRFAVAIIPYTMEHTTMHALQVGDQVNIEYDILGKYIYNMMQSRLS